MPNTLWPANQYCQLPGAPESFAVGDVYNDGSTIAEGDDYLDFSTPVFPALCVMKVSYVTKVAHNVQAITYQMGSGLNDVMEWKWWVTFTLPSGKVYHPVAIQYDKHSATANGNQKGTLPVSYTLPVGTVIEIDRPLVVCVGQPSSPLDVSPNNWLPYNQNYCITGQSINLVGR